MTWFSQYMARAGETCSHSARHFQSIRTWKRSALLGTHRCIRLQVRAAGAALRQFCVGLGRVAGLELTVESELPCSSLPKRSGLSLASWSAPLGLRAVGPFGQPLVNRVASKPPLPADLLCWQPASLGELIKCGLVDLEVSGKLADRQHPRRTLCHVLLIPPSSERFSPLQAGRSYPLLAAIVNSWEIDTRPSSPVRQSSGEHLEPRGGVAF